MATNAAHKYLIVVAGPTAVGKTALSVALARQFATEILSVDSRQFYQEMNIGTAKPSLQELAMVPHHMVGFLPVVQAYDVGQFEEDALRILDQLFVRHQIVIATGGSGLYIKTLCEGIDDMPNIAPEIRQKWNQRLETEGLEALAAMLKEADPDYYAEADLQNPRRVLRALEVHEVTGMPFSVFHTRSVKAKIRPFRVIRIGLSRQRDILYERINCRVDDMLQKGLEQEVRALYPQRLHPQRLHPQRLHPQGLHPQRLHPQGQLNALQTVGYQEFFPYFEGQYPLEEAVRLIKRNTRRFAKRQMTWFRKDKDIRWFDLTAHTEQEVLQQILAFIDKKMKEDRA